MKTAYLKPVDGIQVRDPRTALHLAVEGEDKPLNTYWRRRLKDGDVILAEKKKAGKGKLKRNEE